MKQKKMTGAVRLALLGLALAPLAAEAGVLNYTFNGTDATFTHTQQFLESSGGPSITVTAWKNLGAGWVGTNTGADMAIVERKGSALGVTSGAGDTNPGLLNNSGGRIEGLLFDFGSLLSGYGITDFLNGTAVVGFNSTDRANIWVGNVGSLDAAGGLTGGTQVGINSAADPFTTPSSVFRYLFVATPDQSDPAGAACINGAANQSCWRVDNVTMVVADVETLGEPDQEAIPEPGTLALLGLGGFLLGARRRKPRSA